MKHVKRLRRMRERERERERERNVFHSDEVSLQVWVTMQTTIIHWYNGKCREFIALTYLTDPV